MKRFSWITLIAAASMLFACLGSDETSSPENGDEAPFVQGESEALKINPCALVRCRAGTQCEVQQGHAVCVPTPPECTSDKECRLFSNYCDGCQCLALSTGEPDPVCKGNVVACLIDPCRGAEAQCIRGQCVLGGAAASF
jgi:hypothetical protein